MASILSIAVLAAAAYIPTCRATPSCESSVLPRTHSSSIANCITYKIPVAVTSDNYVFNITKFENNFDLINLVTDYSIKDNDITTFDPIVGTKNSTAEYSISGTFCSPKTASARKKTVLLATHGILYDGRYWNSAYKPSEYNFADAMIAKGFSVFFYDRLGTGQSQK